MGGLFSKNTKETVMICKYQKADFNNKIQIINDAHNLLQFYASALMKDKMPLQMQEYRNFGEIAEDYFNAQRKTVLDALAGVNQKIQTYYDVYKALENLQAEYEKTDMTENERRAKITGVFEVLHVVLQLLVEELRVSCEMQGVTQN
jgi:hypothetical protein